MKACVQKKPSVSQTLALPSAAPAASKPPEASTAKSITGALGVCNTSLNLLSASVLSLSVSSDLAAGQKQTRNLLVPSRNSRGYITFQERICLPATMPQQDSCKLREALYTLSAFGLKHSAVTSLPSCRQSRA